MSPNSTPGLHHEGDDALPGLAQAAGVEGRAGEVQEAARGLGPGGLRATACSSCSPPGVGHLGAHHVDRAPRRRPRSRHARSATAGGRRCAPRPSARRADRPRRRDRRRRPCWRRGGSSRNRRARTGAPARGTWRGPPPPARDCQGNGPRWSPPRMRRSGGNPAETASPSRKRAKSAGVWPVYPPSGLTWFEVDSTSRELPSAFACAIAASSTVGWAEQTDQIPRGSPRFCAATSARSESAPAPAPTRGLVSVIAATPRGARPRTRRRSARDRRRPRGRSPPSGRARGPRAGRGRSGFGEQPLAAQDLVDARRCSRRRRCATSKRAALASVSCWPRASSSRAPRPSASRAAFTASSSSTARRVHTAHWPSRPPAKPTRCGLRPGSRQQVGHDRVVVAGVERHIAGPAALRQRAHHVERLVAVEGRDLDGHDVLDLQEAPPELGVQDPPAHRGLEVEAEERAAPRPRGGSGRAARAFVAVAQARPGSGGPAS